MTTVLQKKIVAENANLKEEIKALITENDSIVVSDRYAVYNYFNHENRQICWAHLARDLLTAKMLK